MIKVSTQIEKEVEIKTNEGFNLVFHKKTGNEIGLHPFSRPKDKPDAILSAMVVEGARRKAEKLFLYSRG